MFDPRAAERSLERYRQKGLDRLERMMLASAARAGVEESRVLDLGGGIGALQTELLESGAASGEVVEIVSSYEPYARELAHERGLEDRTRFRVADVLDSPDVVQPAEIVVLNRVVCCSPDGIRLTAVAAHVARTRLVLSFPRERALVRIGIRLANAWYWLRRRSFRVFLHPRVALVGAAEAEGLRLADGGRVSLWEFAAFERA